MIETLRRFIPPIHSEGYYFVIVFAVISFIIGSFYEALGWVGFVATLWCAYFFRNPERVTPVGDNYVVSPADGLVQKITMAAPPPELNMGDEERCRVSIFLNVFDVHVNRVPASGKIKALHYHPGKFFNASLDKASIHNERQAVLMTTKDGEEIAFTQIAGLIARRILCELQEGQEVKAGERFGLIRFGSRMDIFLPKGVNPLVFEGQRAIGGETIIADLARRDEVRTGETR
jgi:phosphatidylserine decarboxylase